MADETQSLPETELSQVIANYLEAVDEGCAPEPGQLLAQHPHLAGELRSFLAVEEQLARVMGQGTPAAELPLAETISAGRDDSDVAGDDPEPVGEFGKYELLALLGEGGMGVVYKARDRELRRVVALKLIRAGRHARPSERERFRVEAEAAARLTHPGVVQLFEVGEYDGQPFLASEFCAGGSLAEMLAGKPRSAAEAAETVATLAEAVQVAHDARIVHRDLKPANVMLTSDGRLKVGDFGLAKLLDGAEFITGTNAILGSPPYMSPEQAAGKRGVGRATDIYALGAILYEMLTGTPPFRGDTPSETVQLVIREQVVPPSRLNRRVPGDLQTICMRCLEKDPGKRFATAKDLAEELRRFLAGRPIHSRPIGLLGRFWRWCKRNPVPSIAAVVVGAIAGAALGLITMSRNKAVELAEHNGDLANRNGVLAQQNAKVAVENGNLAVANKALAEQERSQRLAVQREAALRVFHQGYALSDGEGRVAEGLTAMTEALTLATDAGGEELQRAIRISVADWQGQLMPLHLLLDHGQRAYRFTYSDNGAVLITAGRVSDGITTQPAAVREGMARVWDMTAASPQGKLLRFPSEVMGVELSPDGRRGVIATAGGGLYLITTASGEKKALIPEADEIAPYRIAISPNGKRALVGNMTGDVQLWDLEAAKPIAEMMSHERCSYLAFTPDGKTMITGGWDSMLRFWDAAGVAVVRPPIPFGANVDAISVSPDSRYLGVIGRRFDPKTKQQSWYAKIIDLKVAAEATVLDLSEHGIEYILFSPSGRHFAGKSGDGKARIWETAALKQTCQPLNHPGVTSIGFTPDSELLLTSGTKGDVRFWQVGNGQSLISPILHPDHVPFFWFNPTGSKLVTACVDGRVRVWDYAARLPTGWTAGVGNVVGCSAYSPDGKSLLVGLGSGAVILDTAGATASGRFVKHPGLVTSVAFSPDSRTAWTAGLDGTVQQWDAATGRSKSGPLRHPKFKQRFKTLALSPDGKIVAVARDRMSGPMGTLVWDTATGALLAELPHDGQVEAISFSADGTRVLTASTEGTARLWEVKSGKLLHELKHPHPLMSAVLSPDGWTILTGGGHMDLAEGELRFWDAETGQPRGNPARFDGAITSIVLSSDGKLALVGSAAGAARVYRVEDGTTLGSDMRHAGGISAIAFSPDAKLALTAGRGAQLWDVETGLPVGPIRRSTWQLNTVGVRPDGRQLVAAGSNGQVYFWEPPVPAELTPAQLTDTVRVQTAMTYTRGQIVKLSSAEWQQTRARLAETVKLPGSASNDATWNRRQAELYERTTQWHGSWWHLNQLTPDAGQAGLALLKRRAQLALRAEQWRAAEADYTELIQRDPDEAAFRRGRAVARLSQRQWSAASDDLLVAVKLDAEDWRNWHLAGTCFSEQGNWKEAVAAFRTASESPTAPLEVFMDEGLALLQRRQLAEYRKACERMDRKLGNSAQVQTAGNLAWTWSLAPNAVEDKNVPVMLAEAAVDADPRNPLYARALGAALYRSGKYKEALKQLDAAQRLRPEPAPALWLFQALSLHKTADKNAAATFEKAKQWITEARKAEGDSPSRWELLPWQERVAVESLLMEAEAAIGSK